MTEHRNSRSPDRPPRASRRGQGAPRGDGEQNRRRREDSGRPGRDRRGGNRRGVPGRDDERYRAGGDGREQGTDRDKRGERQRGGRGRRPGSASGRATSRSRGARVSPARLAAFDALTQVEASDAYANLVLPPLLRERGITGRDAAFATELTYGTLRMRARYDAVVNLVSSRPVSDQDAAVAHVLRLGTHQLLAMRVPDHAAVSESVALARQVGGEGQSNFVNAVLRRISEHPAEHWLAQLGEVAGEAGLDVPVAAAVHSHPAWMIRAIRAALGKQATPAELEAALVASNTPAPVNLSLRPGLAGPQDLPADSGEPGTWAPTAWILQAGDPGELPAVASGGAGVQDEGSQLVTLALSEAELDGPDATWLDLCAGPGGKAALLGALLAQRAPEGVLVANEVAPHRAALVQESVRAVRRQLPGLQVRTGDGREVGGSEPGRYDRVLVDAPCTGMGALRRRPEARWRRTPDDLSTLAPLQRELLTSALHAVRPGGVVAYVTCSPHVAETELVVADVLASFPGAELLDAPGVLARVAGRDVVGHRWAPPGSAEDASSDAGAGEGGQSRLVEGGPSGAAERSEPGVAEGSDAGAVDGSDGAVAADQRTAQLWPHRHGTDAMFLALIRR